MTDARVALSLNCGSSSLKFALFGHDGDNCEALIDGEAEAIGAPGAGFRPAPDRPISPLNPIACKATRRPHRVCSGC